MEVILASIALLPPLAHCGNKIRRAVKEIRSSRQDILDLTDETVNFSGLCEDYLRACADKPEARTCRSSSIRHLQAWIRKLLKGLQDILGKVRALKPNGRRGLSIEKTIIAYIEWFLSKSSIQRLRASMTVARGTIIGFSNLMNIQKLNEELQMLRSALASPSHRKEVEKSLGMTIEEKIESINQALDIKASLHKTNDRQLKAAREEVKDKKTKVQHDNLVPAPLELFKISATLDTYAKEVLPSRQASRRTFSSKASNRTNAEERNSCSRASFTPTTSESDPTTSSSSSAISSRSCQSPVIVPSSISSNTAPPEIIVEDDAPYREETQRPDPVGRPRFTYTSTRGREYMDDPEGTILSPPKVKVHTPNASHKDELRVGRHIIRLNDDNVTVNAHSLHMNDHKIGEDFFKTLKEHPSLLDSLDEALAKGLENWDGIPDWVVMPSGVPVRNASG